ncbi:MAG: type II toxin-antitoxin system RelE/ParE family toxin [Lachnospiraceae bacterium]|nr:type II toxin-antitoxin system RelE/ParE family toxin [Lachnospiraceae bacterium]
MSEYKLIMLPEAQKDIRDIVLYIARDLASPQAALSLQADFEKTIKSLAERPKRIKTVNEQPWKDAGIRKIRVKNYYIYFLVDDDEMAVKVIAVIYIGRSQTKQMADRKMEDL